MSKTFVVETVTETRSGGFILTYRVGRDTRSIQSAVRIEAGKSFNIAADGKAIPARR